MLPDFLIMGAARAGTKNLTRYLEKHPEICMPKGISEIQYFGRNYEKGEEWYKKHFDGCKKDQVIGEKSATYMPSEKAGKKIKKDLPDTKLIFLLRNPMDRTYSHYWMMKKLGREDLSFEEAIEKKPETYIKPSLYIKHLKRFEDLPENQKKIIISENYWENPIETVKEVFDFLEVDSDIDIEKPESVKKGKAPRSNTVAKISCNKKLLPIIHKIPFIKNILSKMYNKVNLKNNYPEMKEKTRRKLQEKFKPYNQELRGYLDRDTLNWE